MTLVKFNNHPVKTFDNIFNDFFTGFPSHSTQQQSAAAPVNIKENNNGFDLEFSVPGRNKEEFKIELEKGLLTISFEAKESEQPAAETKVVRREFSIGSFKRSFHVDEKIDLDNIQAKYENGILKVFLPKKQEVAPTSKQINVQ